MCSICGICDFVDSPNAPELLQKMNGLMKHRGPDESDIFCDTHVNLGHNRLAVIDIENGKQPFSVVYGNKKYVIVYNGEIYNCEELRKELKEKGFTFFTSCDTEVVLYAYILYREDCPAHLNGIFAFCVYDGESVFLCRDRFGVKPLYYAIKGNTLIFASEIKSMLAHPKISSDVSREGLWEVLYLSPNFIAGKTPFDDVSELPPASFLFFSKRKTERKKYWQIEARPYLNDRKYAVETTRELLFDAIERQLVSDVPLCVLLSGGLDSGVVTAVANRAYRKKGKTLSTYSFEYEGNKENFENSVFQPNADDDYATYLANELGTKHTVLTVPTDEVARDLAVATSFRDLPGQADIDSSLYYFCKEIKKNHTVGLSGECSDEIFGGYPWFYRKEMTEGEFFPWIFAPRLRPSLFKDSVSNAQEGFDYIRQIYRDSIRECSTLKTDSESMRLSRIGSHLSVNYFMTSLLQRKDRMSMASGVEIRVPFADHRIYEFVYNVPWEIKFENGVEKALLRNSMAGMLPDKILYRKKSPYPKTHNPRYFEAVQKLFWERYQKSDYLKETLDTKKLEEVLSSNQTWFGQLMGAPQLLAWLVQFDTWLEKYHVNLK